MLGVGIYVTRHKMNGCRLLSKISQRKHEKGEKCTSQTKVKVNRWFSIKFSRDGEININIRGSSASYICVGVFKRCNISYVSIVGHSFSPYMFPFVLFLELSIETSTNCRSVFNRSTPSNQHTHTHMFGTGHIFCSMIYGCLILTMPYQPYAPTVSLCLYIYP